MTTFYRQPVCATAREYLDFLRSSVERQRRAQSAILNLLRDVVEAALEHDWNGKLVSDTVPYELKRFGSREYDNAVLTSD